MASFEKVRDSVNNLDISKVEQNPNKQIIPILRVKDIEETRMDYQNLGEWVKQKHESGAEHYALEDKSCVDLEIYPERKTSKGDVELFFNQYAFPNDNYFEIIKHDDIKMLALDPEGRHISIFPFGT